MGVPFRKPVTQMRETVEALRGIFRGEKVTMAGKMVTVTGPVLSRNGMKGLDVTAVAAATATK